MAFSLLLRMRLTVPRLMPSSLAIWRSGCPKTTRVRTLACFVLAVYGWPLRWPRLVLFFIPKPGGSSLDVSLCKRKDILAGEQREISSLKRVQSPFHFVRISHGPFSLLVCRYSSGGEWMRITVFPARRSAATVYRVLSASMRPADECQLSSEAIGSLFDPWPLCLFDFGTSI